MEYEYWLGNVYQISSEKRTVVRELAGSAKKLYHMKPGVLSELHILTEEEQQILIHSRDTFCLAEEWEILQKKKIRYIPYFHPEYPERLKHIYNSPYGLYVKGNLPVPSHKSVGIVGARMCSEYGRSIAKKIGEVLSQYQVSVISGLARGIDSAAQAGALSGGGETYAVLGCGCDICYPRSSRNLYDNILESGGGIVSEYGPGIQPLQHFFPARNRIISGLSDAIVVVEAKERSGSLITADFALEQGKDIFAVPGRFQEPLSMGCNKLIEQGAGIIYNMDCFLNNLGIVSDMKKKSVQFDKNTLEKEEMLVYSCLDLHPKFINLIIEETGLNLLTVLHALDTLRQKKLVQETFQNYFCKILQ